MFANRSDNLLVGHLEMTRDGGDLPVHVERLGCGHGGRNSSQTMFLRLLHKSERQGRVALWYWQSTCASVSQAYKAGGSGVRTISSKGGLVFAIYLPFRPQG
jgi:hypothetical protein